MESKYITKVEDKFVFNFSLIFWHLLVLLAALAIVVGICVFAWSVVPASQPRVVEQPYPEKRTYPEPVQVAVSELNIEEFERQTTPEPTPEPIAMPAPVRQEPVRVQQRVLDDDAGKQEYDASLGILRELIPPAKYPWEGQGYWTYPYGQRYWDVYKQERYRRWNVTEPGLEGKLNDAYGTSNAPRYPEKKKLLDGLIGIVRALPEEDRLTVLQDLVSRSRLAKDLDRNNQMHEAIAASVKQVGLASGRAWIGNLASFGRDNPNDGVALINYINSAIGRFREVDRPAVIGYLLNSYYNYFGQDLTMQKEATDMFLPLMDRIPATHQVKAMDRYYGLYLAKNGHRNQEIVRIDQEHQRTLAEIDQANAMAHAAAEASRRQKELLKEASRGKAMIAVGGGVLLIVLVATMLVFLSIQRIVRRIEAKLPLSSNTSA